MTADDPLRRFLESRVAEGWMPGAVWWVEGPRGVHRGAVGRAVESPAPEDTTERTPYDLASLTKPLATAPLLVLLEQEGILDLDAPAGSFLGALEGSAWAAASLVSLARHTAGLPAWLPLFAAGEALEDYLARIALEPAAGPPGRVLYSDPGYIVLGAVLERVTSKDLPRLFEDRLARPLGLERTAFAQRGEICPDAAATERANDFERAMAGAAGAGYRWRDRIARGEVHDANAHALGGAAGHAGLFGTAREVAAIAREFIEPRALPLGDRARERLLRPVNGRTVGFVAAEASAAARGILSDPAPGHTGFTGTSLWLDPAARRLFVLLTNRVHPRVPEREFHWLRRGFHRLARRLV